MRRKVLLARPHDFIVHAMKPFIDRNGYEPVVATAFDDLPRLAVGDLAGAVLSTAATSIVRASFSEVYELVRRLAPMVPIAVSSLGKPSSAKLILDAELPRSDREFPLLPLEESSLTHPAVGTTRAFVYLTPPMLVPAGQATLADQLIRAHFR